jgi:hypothetical protein
LRVGLGAFNVGIGGGHDAEKLPAQEPEIKPVRQDSRVKVVTRRRAPRLDKCSKDGNGVFARFDPGPGPTRSIPPPKIYSVLKTPTITAMFPSRLFVLFGLSLLLGGCATYQMGNDHADDNGSYSGGTLNSPVTDQNPHVGGDSSYPSSVDDEGRQQVPPGKTDY